ncbi:hypothetical protein B0H15DRAFT_803944 [Mycena belliarum]|uniref:Uncharacterized protein n=1 Tax=Mycena belliarum TaxID=1033014 RepID=A0AAD6TVE4_9AGAR|nr:hypothetical protein B0H15DRAFT_803944 [Mycena belliae]
MKARMRSSNASAKMVRVLRACGPRAAGLENRHGGLRARDGISEIGRYVLTALGPRLRLAGGSEAWHGTGPFLAEKNRRALPPLGTAGVRRPGFCAAYYEAPEPVSGLKSPHSIPGLNPIYFGLGREFPCLSHSKLVPAEAEVHPSLS